MMQKTLREMAEEVENEIEQLREELADLRRENKDLETKLEMAYNEIGRIRKKIKLCPACQRLHELKQ